jgi:hypothetical protein
MAAARPAPWRDWVPLLPILPLVAYQFALSCLVTTRYIVTIADRTASRQMRLIFRLPVCGAVPLARFITRRSLRRGVGAVAQKQADDIVDRFTPHVSGE